MDYTAQFKTHLNDAPHILVVDYYYQSVEMDQQEWAAPACSQQRLAQAWFGLDEAAVSRGHTDLHSTAWHWRNFWLHLSSSFFHERENTLTCLNFFYSPAYKKADFWVSFPTPTLCDCRSTQVWATVCFCWWWAGSDPDLGHFWLTHERDAWLGSGKEDWTAHISLSGERTL